MNQLVEYLRGSASHQKEEGWLHRKDDHSRRRFVEVRRTFKLAFQAAKGRSWREFGERLESGNRSPNKTFWQTIHRVKGKKVGGVGQVKSKNGTFLSDEKSILCRCRDYFSELLNLLRGTEGGRSEVSVRSVYTRFGN